MENEITASIIIRAYNEEKHIERLLEGIKGQKASFRFETVVVDSGSTDRTLEIARDYGTRIVTVTPDEFSFGYSLNMGIEAAGGESCVFISAHCYPADENWLEQLIAPFSDSTIALVYGKQRGNHTTKYPEHQIFAKWYPETGGKQRDPFCNNASAAIRKSLWREHRYDESLTGLEDIAWAKHVISKGYSLYYAAAACVIHVHDETYAQIYRRYEREAIAMKAIYSHESFSLFEFLKLFILNTLSDYGHAAHDRVLTKNFFVIPTMRFMQFLGTYRGYNYKKPITSRLKQHLYYPSRPDVFKKRSL